MAGFHPPAPGRFCPPGDSLAAAGLPICPARAAELTQTMCELTFRLSNTPDDRHQLRVMHPEQSELYDFFR